MDAELAIKLKALLGHCNGGHFDRLHSALKESLVDARSLNDFRLVYRRGADEEAPPTKRQYIDLMHRYEFLPA